MTDKSPLQQLTEWQELSDYYLSLYTKDLVAPENSLSVAVDHWHNTSVIINNCTLRARWKLNGKETTRDVTFSTSGIQANNGASAVEAVKKLAASIAEDVTKGLEEEMLRFLIQNDQYNTIRPLIMSELYKQ
jgi:hypothetical protein